MPCRTRPLVDPVEIHHDGTRLLAERGEPIAYALIASDRLPLARSPKLHRPRGPYCLKGGCDGCLARVDGVPDVMTCQTTVRGGERVETQNVLGTRGVDALRAADFLFPKGIDHHRLFAGIRGVSDMVQTFARQVAGLGRLPDRTEAIRAAEHLEVAVLIIGGGASGLALAAELGALALLVDDGAVIGGSMRALTPERVGPLVERAEKAGATLRRSTMAAGLFREPEGRRPVLRAVLLGPDRATLVEAHAVVLATGAHDVIVPFGSNDLPGVTSARAALMLHQSGISLGKRLAVVGGGRFADALGKELGASVVVRTEAEGVVRAVGRSKVTGVIVREDGAERRERVDAIVVDGPGAPALELGVQAGARAAFDPRHGYVLELERELTLGPDLYAVGSVLAGRRTRSDVSTLARQLRKSATSR